MNVLCRQQMEQFCSSSAETQFNASSLTAARKRCSVTYFIHLEQTRRSVAYFHIISTALITLWVSSSYARLSTTVKAIRRKK